MNLQNQALFTTVNETKKLDKRTNVTELYRLSTNDDVQFKRGETSVRMRMCSTSNVDHGFGVREGGSVQNLILFTCLAA